MGLESATNQLMSKIFTSVVDSNSLVFNLGLGALSFVEISYSILSKFDRSSPSAISKIDKIILDSRGADGKANEGKVAIVTGANSGIGYETAKALARAGFHTILACRNVEAGIEAVDKLKRQTDLDSFEVMELDLASIASVKEFVEEFKGKDLPLNILVNNAGVMMTPYMQTKDGIEMQFGTNVVGHFALTTGLLDVLKSTGDGRIVNVSSMAAFFTKSIDYECITDKGKYSKMNNYSISKLGNIMVSNDLARKLEGTGVTSNSLHPGAVATNIGRHVGTSSIQSTIESALMLDTNAGALMSIYLALSPEVKDKTGAYYARGLETDAPVFAQNGKEQEKLWEFIEKLVASKSTKPSE